MIICVCEGVSDREIRTVTSQGAHSLEAIKKACRAGGDCGMCRPQLRRMAHEARNAQPPAAARA